MKSLHERQNLLPPPTMHYLLYDQLQKVLAVLAHNGVLHLVGRDGLVLVFALGAHGMLFEGFLLAVVGVVAVLPEGGEAFVVGEGSA